MGGVLELASGMLTKLGRHFKCRFFIALYTSEISITNDQKSYVRTPYNFIEPTPILGGRSATVVPQLLSAVPSVNSNVQPSVKNSCVIQLLVYGLPFSVAFWI
jgi:hypothetical protein